MWKVGSLFSPAAKEVVATRNQIATFQQQVNERVADVNNLIDDMNKHVRFLQDLHEKNAHAIDKILYGFERDVPSLQQQAEALGWSAGVFDLPYFDKETIFFNPSVIELANGERLLFVRHATFNPHIPPPYNTFSKIAWMRLDDTKVDTNMRFIELPTGVSNKEQWEDPRVQRVGNKLWLTCTNFIQAGPSQPGTGAHQAMAVLDTQTMKPIGINHPVYGNNGRTIHMNKGHEKNWTWIFHDNKPHMIYSMKPHVVVECDMVCQPVKEYVTEDMNPLWYHGEPRGGSNPVRIGDEYFAFFHSSTPWWNGRRRYFMGAYAFEAKPPFRITRMTSLPLLMGSNNDKRVLEFPLVVFPGGAVFDEQKQEWFVVYGINDCMCGWVKIPHDQLLSLMWKLPRTTEEIDESIQKETPDSLVATRGIHTLNEMESAEGSRERYEGVDEESGNAGYPPDDGVGEPDEVGSEGHHSPNGQRVQSDDDVNGTGIPDRLREAETVG